MAKTVRARTLNLRFPTKNYGLRLRSAHSSPVHPAIRHESHLRVALSLCPGLCAACTSAAASYMRHRVPRASLGRLFEGCHFCLGREFVGRRVALFGNAHRDTARTRTWVCMTTSYVVESTSCAQEGHSLSGKPLQTYDLGSTMGDWVLAGGLSGAPGDYGEPPKLPFTGTISVATFCPSCPVFVDPRTGNVIQLFVDFEVTIECGLVRDVRRTSEPAHEWLVSRTDKPEGTLLGPMTLADASRRPLR